jgi:hypothetical protein
VVIGTMMEAGDQFLLSDRITRSTDAMACKHRFHVVVEDLLFQAQKSTEL